ncbi:MAG: type II secretion system protein GspK [Planctomycetota bacterium]|nr:type II secretion system protein GspK [Planctomycetota bacterium]
MIAEKLQPRSAHKGFALIAVMWVVLIAGVMLLGVQKAVRANLAMAHNELESVRAYWLARAGVEQAMAVLADDDAGVDGAWDTWYSNADSFEKVELLGGTFSVVAPPSPWGNPRKARYGLVDHSGRLNINVADNEQLKSLCGLADWQVDSILDWCDKDDQTRPGGAEALFYLRMDYPYLIRNGPLQTISELQLVRGIDWAVFAGEDVNLNGVLDVNEDDLQASKPDDDGDGQLLLGLGGLVTVYSYERNRDANGEKRINVNTVDKETLIQQFNFTDALAEAVVNYGSGKSKSGKSEGTDKSKNGKSSRFGSLMDLLKVKAEKKDSRSSSDGDEEKVNEITVKWLATNFDKLTLSDDDRLPGKINVNTAPREVLLTLPKMNSTTADAIGRRQGAGEGPFNSVGELLTGETISEDQFKAFAERVTVRSSVFEICSTGVTKWGIRYKIIAVLDRGVKPMAILYWHQSE